MKAVRSDSEKFALQRKGKEGREVTSTMQARTQEILSLLAITSRICFNIFSFIFHNPVSFVILIVKSKRAPWQIELVLLQLQPLFRKNLKLTTITVPSGCWLKNQRSCSSYAIQRLGGFWGTRSRIGMNGWDRVGGVWVKAELKLRNSYKTCRGSRDEDRRI